LLIAIFYTRQSDDDNDPALPNEDLIDPLSVPTLDEVSTDLVNFHNLPQQHLCVKPPLEW
jgi:hypothetical protein